MIQLFHVSKFYDRRPALSDVTLEIEKGEFVLLMGPSGAGKSTLLKLLIGAERPEEGQILVQGRSLSKLRPSEIPVLRRKVGIVLQDFRLLPKKTVFENVASALEVIGKPSSHIKKVVPEVLEVVGLEGKEQRRPDELSGGEQQRVSIARALANRPPVILADEPTAPLDSVRAMAVIRILNDMAKRFEAAIIVVTHDEKIIPTFKRIYHIRDGVTHEELGEGRGFD